MTRRECEDKLLQLAKQADAILKAYNPNADKLCFDIRHGQINVDAMYADTDINAVDYSDKESTYSVYVTEFADGNVWHTDRWMEAVGRVTA